MFPYGMWPYGLFPCAVKLNNTGCQWRIDTNPPYLLSPPKYIFLLEMENKFGKTKQKFFYDHFEMIVPAKPQEFQNLYTSATSVYLQWEAPEFIEHDDFARSQLRYQLKVKQMRRDEESETSILDIGNKESYTLTNLTPYTNYEISIRCRIANGTSEEKWSKENILKTKTKDAIPYISPKFLTFESKGQASERNITLLWTSILTKYYNGDNFHYLIRYFPFDINSDYEVYEQIVPSTQTSYTFTNLGNVSYKFSIYSENSKGRCYDSSSLIVPEIRRLSRKPFKLQLKKHSPNTYNLKWNNLMYSKENVSFVVVWCLSSIFFECKESAYSMIVNSSSEIVSVNITTKTDGAYRFGVSAMSPNWSSGVVWITSTEDQSDKNNHSELAMTRMVAFSLIFILIGIMIAFMLMCLKKSVENYRSLKNMSIKLPDGIKPCQHQECNKLSKNKEFAVCVNCEHSEDKKSVSSREHRLSCDSNDSAFIDVTANGNH
ncbi:uncharacterized protein B4U80_12907 [Leptotrombidium deliense]|uniref:Fibronectin type-III domain-containing protein n=1 Tax=Leptotrombidium deliense TaxID=299467 RepID=A0A443SHM2_9ACAR|nr:uncharacterized protein B4U80_12907 [Leptotrombidium deliense]